MRYMHALDRTPPRVNKNWFGPMGCPEVPKFGVGQGLKNKGQIIIESKSLPKYPQINLALAKKKSGDSELNSPSDFLFYFNNYVFLVCYI